MSKVPANETAEQLIARLQKENAALKEALPKPRAISMRVSAKGAISIYGFGRFPLTVYKTNMLKLLSMEPEIRAFIKAHESELTVKPGAEEEEG